MDNQSLARVLQDIADVLEIKGESFFRIRSYRLSAESVGSHGEDVAEMIRRGDDLGSITGVGGGIAAKLRELVETGRCEYHEELLSEIPRSLLDLLQLPGLGPKGVSPPRRAPWPDHPDDGGGPVRRREQKRGGRGGDRAGVVLLDHRGEEAKPPRPPPVVADLAAILSAARPEVVYTHNLADKHDT